MNEITKYEFLEHVKIKLSEIKILLDHVEIDLCSDSSPNHNNGYLYAMTIIYFFNDIKIHCETMYERLKKEGVIKRD